MMLVTSSSPRRHVISRLLSPSALNDSFFSGTPTVVSHSAVDTSSTAFQDQGRALSSMQLRES